jgi:beta-lactamase regulating signal transducer with metallopeptidase domain
MFDHSTFTAWSADALIQGTVLITLALIANSLMRQASAAWRHSLLLFTAIGLPLLLILSLFIPAHKFPRSEFISDSFGTVATQSVEFGIPEMSVEGANDPFLPHPTSVAQATALSSSEYATHLADTWTLSSWLFLFWAVGVGVIWLRIGFGIRSLSRFKAEPVGSSSVLEQVIAKEASAMGLAKSPALVSLNSDLMPMTWRLRRHFLALPKLAKKWPENKLRNIIRHELAHIRRNDCYTSWLADACLALFWFHPLAWLLRRALGQAREAACDDLTLGEHPAEGACHQYASDLLDVIAGHSRRARPTGLGLALAMANRRMGIRNRLEAILDSARDRRTVSHSARIIASSMGIVGLSILASLAACRRTDSSNIPPTTGSHVQIKLQTVEFEDPTLLEKLFDTDSNNREYTGFLSLEKLDELLENLSQSGITLQNHPRLVSSPGKTATAEVIREFIYPTEYDPPELPTESETSDSGPFPVTPSTPTSFETRNVGLSYEVIASRAGTEGIGIDMKIEHSRFLGFVNYGSPIMGTTKGILGGTTPIVITENRIEMPVFQSQRYDTELVIPFGYTVALIGFAPSGDPNMQNALQPGSNPPQERVGPMKHTLYLIQAEFVDGPKTKISDK